jgi:hypothetical protein
MRSIALLELIFALFILFGISLFTSTFYYNIYQHNHTQQESAKQHLDLLSTQLFLFKLFKTSKIQTVHAGHITFMQTAYEEFLSNVYSGYINLDNSSKIKVHSPFSNAHKTDASAILFDHTTQHALTKSNEKEYFYFTNPNSSKKVYETYALIKHSSNISVQNNVLYYNDTVLLNNVSKFETQLQNGVLNIDICHYKRCDAWVFLL